MIFLCPRAYPFLIAIGTIGWYFPWWTLGVYLTLAWGVGFWDAFRTRRFKWEGVGRVILPVQHQSVDDAMNYPHFQGDFPKYRLVYTEPISEVLWRGFVTPLLIPVLLIVGVPIL